MHLSSASPRGGGGPRADVGTLLIVHFKVLVFPHQWGLFFLQSPRYLAKPSTQLDLKMQFRTFKKIHFEKSIKTAAEVIDALHENTLYEIAPEFSKVVSVLAAIPTISCSAES